MAVRSGGFVDKVLRVDLSTGKCSTEDTFARYGALLGGAGIGNRVLWDEVPAGTGPFDPANKLIFAAGVLVGTSVPCNGRTTATMGQKPKARTGSGNGMKQARWIPWDGSSNWAGYRPERGRADSNSFSNTLIYFDFSHSPRSRNGSASRRAVNERVDQFFRNFMPAIHRRLNPL